MMKNRLRIAALLGACVVLASSCGRLPGTAEPQSTAKPAVASSGQSAASADSGAGEHVKKQLLQNVLVDAAVTAPKAAEQAGTLAADYLPIEKQKAAALLDGSAVKKQQTYDDGICDKLKSSFLTTSDGKTLLAGGVQTMFTTPEYQYISQIFSVPDSPWARDDRYSKTAELPFMSQKDAARKVTDLLRSFGITVSEQYSVLALDHASLKAGEDWIRDNTDYFAAVSLGEGKTDEVVPKNIWTADDDCYDFTFWQEIGGVRLTPESLSGSGSEGVCEGIEVMFCKSGVIYLNVMGAYAQKGGGAGTTIGLDAALNALKQKFDSLLLGQTKITVTDILLCYAPVFSDKKHTVLSLVPVWHFTCTQKTQLAGKDGGAGSGEETTQLLVDVNALTGAEIQ